MTDPIQIASPASTINRSRYSGKDFFTAIDDMVARIQALFVTEFNDFVTSGTGQMLVDMVAWAVDTVSFYIDRQATESYLATARTRKAVVRLARANGYKPAAAVAPSVDLEVRLAEVQGIDTFLPEDFQFLGPGDRVFQTVEAATFPAGEGPTSAPRTVGLVQGETRVEVFASNGTRSQVFRLSPGVGRFIAASGVTVTVDGAPWTEGAIITFDQTDQFELGVTDEPPTLRFGDGVAGNIPQAGAEIRIEYLATLGTQGAVLAETIGDVVFPLVIGGNEIELLFTNPLPTTPGADREAIETVKANAPRFFRTQGVAVTRQDYEDLAVSFVDPIAGSVSVAQAFVARSADDDLQLAVLLNNIRVIMNTVEPAVTGAASAIDTANDALRVLRDDAVVSATLLANDLVSMASSLADLKTTAADTKSRAAQIGVDAADVQTHTTDGSAVVDAILIAGISQLTTDDKISIKGFFDLAAAEASAIQTAASGVSADADSIIGSAVSAEDQDPEDNLTDIQLGLSSMTAQLDAIDAQAVVLNDAVTNGFETSIESQLEAIFDHVDSFLSADCKANLIEVPILTRDATGFLIPPPIALVRALQARLEQTCEVTQVPEVVSGELFLVPAVIVGRIGVLSGYVHATVISNVRAAIDNLLRVRAFGASLRKSDLDSAVVGAIEGVKYANWSITGPTEHLDSDGNLIIPARLVITKGSVALTPETAAA